MKVFCNKAHCFKNIFDEDSLKWICMSEEILIGDDGFCSSFLNERSSVGWYGRSAEQVGETKYNNQMKPTHGNVWLI